MYASKGMRNFFDQLHHFLGELQILWSSSFFFSLLVVANRQMDEW